MTNEEILSKIVQYFSNLTYVDAIVLSGSKTGLINDEMSDFDIYVYTNNKIPLKIRKKLVMECAEEYELSNDYFEYGDEWITKETKTNFDIMYRNISFAKEEINNVWKKHKAKVGYTTALLYNIKNSKILYEKNLEFTKLKKILNSQYPKKLKENIIKKNYPLLKNKMSASYYEQIEKAIKRKDIVNVNNRISAILSSYFDILFAVNKCLHPGEKKLLKYASRICDIIPNNFEKNIENVILNAGNKNILKYLDILLNELDIIL